MFKDVKFFLDWDTAKNRHLFRLILSSSTLETITRYVNIE